MKERLQKAMAHAGVASRRKCEALILQGRVRVNGQVVTQLGSKVHPIHDTIEVDGQLITPEEKVYILLHKPRGYLSDTRDFRGRSSALGLVPAEERLYPVGRLDAESEGLLLLTNDGELAHRLTHPRYEHTKEYHVYVEGYPNDETLKGWRQGVFVDGRQTAPAQISVLRREGDRTWLRVVLREGRKRQIRQVAAILGHPVHQLIRVRIGPVQLGNLKPGEWRYLTKRELKKLQDPKQQLSNASDC
jgi:23S rRNA pseudouridine2605 synthase